MFGSSTNVQPATGSEHQLRPTLGTSRDVHRRLLLHHLPIALASAIVTVLFMGLSPFRGSMHGANASDALFGLSFEPGSRTSMSQLTIATGYVATVLLAVTLLIGPTNLLLRRRNPVSTYLRRDVGTWTAVFGVVHVVVGLHPERVRNGLFSFVDYFFVDGKPLTNAFGWGNWTGLAATVLVVGLLALSTDGSLRELKVTRWKNWQRLNYALFALVVAHAVAYGARRGLPQWVEQWTSPYRLVLVVTVISVLVGQMVGIWLWRRRIDRTGASTVSHERPRVRAAG